MQRKFRTNVSYKGKSWKMCCIINVILYTGGKLRALPNTTAAIQPVMTKIEFHLNAYVTCQSRNMHGRDTSESFGNSSFSERYFNRMAFNNRASNIALINQEGLTTRAEHGA
jgi:hypothetical protein